MASILDKGWGNVSPNFSGSNQSMSTSVSALANAGTIFDKLSNTLEQQEQNRINNQINFEKLAIAQDANRREEEEAAYTMLEREEVGQALELENDILRQSTNADGSTNLQKYSELLSKMRQSVKTAGAEKALTDLYQQRFKNNDTIVDNKRADAQLSLSRANHALSASRFAYEKQRDIVEDRQKASEAAQEANRNRLLNMAYINASNSGNVTAPVPSQPTSSMSPDAHIERANTLDTNNELVDAVLSSDFKTTQAIVGAGKDYQESQIKFLEERRKEQIKRDEAQAKLDKEEMQAAAEFAGMRNKFPPEEQQRIDLDTKGMTPSQAVTYLKSTTSTTKRKDSNGNQYETLKYNSNTPKKFKPSSYTGLVKTGQEVPKDVSLKDPAIRTTTAETSLKNAEGSEHDNWLFGTLPSKSKVDNILMKGSNYFSSKDFLNLQSYASNDGWYFPGDGTGLKTGFYKEAEQAVKIFNGTIAAKDAPKNSFVANMLVYKRNDLKAPLEAWEKAYLENYNPKLIPVTQRGQSVSTRQNNTNNAITPNTSAAEAAPAEKIEALRVALKDNTVSEQEINTLASLYYNGNRKRLFQDLQFLQKQK